MQDVDYFQWVNVMSVFIASLNFLLNYGISLFPCYLVVKLIRPLNINGLFLVQNFPKLNARARRQNKKEKTKSTLSY